MPARQAATLLQALQQEPSVSVRLNPFKLKDAPEGAVRVPWSPYGYMLPDRPAFTMDPLFHAGAYYVQDSSAMFVGHLFRQVMMSCRQEGRPLRVLDLCAAPGGKTTDIAASMREALGGGGYVLVANEVMRSRAAVLSDNVARWGDADVTVTSCDPAAFARYEGFFDIIVADVPCSGEGMFRKDGRAVEDWSEKLVEVCAARQRRILGDVWPALRPSGVLLYSTCTFNSTENDAQVEWICDSLGAEVIPPDGSVWAHGVVPTRYGSLLIPGCVPGEGQYAAALRRSSAASLRGRPCPGLEQLRPLRSGLVKGQYKGADFVPSEDWALSLEYDRSAYPEAELDLAGALAYLHRDTLVLPDAPKGYVAVTYRDIPLGFVKNIGTRCNNLHPASRRILKDICNYTI